MSHEEEKWPGSAAPRRPAYRGEHLLQVVPRRFDFDDEPVVLGEKRGRMAAMMQVAGRIEDMLSPQDRARFRMSSPLIAQSAVGDLEPVRNELVVSICRAGAFYGTSVPEGTTALTVIGGMDDEIIDLDGLPPSVKTLQLLGDIDEGFHKVPAIPEGITTLALNVRQTSDIARLPSSVRTLKIGNIPTHVEFEPGVLPPELSVLDLGTRAEFLRTATLPSSLSLLICRAGLLNFIDFHMFKSLNPSMSLFANHSEGLAIRLSSIPNVKVMPLESIESRSVFVPRDEDIDRVVGFMSRCAVA